jgi:hypothetical protein
VVVLIAGLAAAAGAGTDPTAAELDARAVPWETVRRLALQAGLFPPATQPVSGAELAALLQAVAADGRRRAAAGAPPDPADARVTEALLDRFQAGPGHAAWQGCDCKESPPAVRIGGRALAGWTELGGPLSGEADAAWDPGWNLDLETEWTVSAMTWWLTVTPRLQAPLGGGAALAADDPLAWPGWPWATGRPQVGASRTGDGVARVDLPRAVTGVTLGRWALSAGWDARRTGPGLDGGLLLDRGGPSFAAVTARRTEPFRWFGVMAPLAPDQLLLRAGRLSRREVRFRDEFGDYTRSVRPWHFQWLVGWKPTRWSRVSASHAVMAAARDNSLWPDLLQLLFPVTGTTIREMDSGPATDRLFAVQMEARWRDAPWPLLPSDGGRLWWEYGGTDFLPSGPWGVIPEISIPASIIGCELVSPRWDLAVEYAELEHEFGLWYSNGGFPEGYTHRGGLLGHELGGSGESWAGSVRLRPGEGARQVDLKVKRATWGLDPRTPGTGREWTVTVGLGSLPGHGALRAWRIAAEWRRTTADRAAFTADPRPAARDWWRSWLAVDF